MRISKKQRLIKPKKKTNKGYRKVNPTIKKKSKSSKKNLSPSKNRDQKAKLQKIDKNVTDFFKRASLSELAIKTGFLIRQSKMTPFIFLYALIMGGFGCGTSLDLLALDMNALFKTKLTGQAFYSRLKEKKSLVFLKSCFESFLNLQLESSFENNYSTVFSMFNGVILEDSTVITLNERIAKTFKGSGGLASKSALKLNWVFNICCYCAINIELFSGSKPDQKNPEKSLKYLKKGTLIIRDLGYFSLKCFSLIEKKCAYYLSRLRKGMYIYQSKNDEEPVDIQSFFKKLTKGNNSVKTKIWLGKEERVETFLYLQKVPKWVHKMRIKQYKKRNSGKNPSSDFVIWSNYSVYITNIPDELLINDNLSLLEIVMEIYKIRWQIELLFKKFKSGVKINFLKGKSPNHIRCMVYGKLISLMLCLMVLSYAASHRYKGREISLWKVTRWLVSLNRLATAILEGTFYKLYSDLSTDFKLLSRIDCLCMYLKMHKKIKCP